MSARHETAPNNRELSDPNRMLWLRNSPDSEINSTVLGHVEYILLQGKLTDKPGNCADGAGEVIGISHHFSFGGWFNKESTRFYGPARRFFSGDVQ